MTEGFKVFVLKTKVLNIPWVQILFYLVLNEIYSSVEEQWTFNPRVLGSTPNIFIDKAFHTLTYQNGENGKHASFRY